MSPLLRAAVLFIGVGVLAACSHNNDSNSNDAGMSGVTAPARGSLIQSPPTRLVSLSQPDLLSLLSGNLVGQQLLELALAPKCQVDVHQLQYNTVGGAGEPTTASGALMVPSGSDSSCHGPRPIVLYAHGTTTDKAYNIANVKDANNLEGLLLATVFASQGYIVVAPNYVGYDTSTSTYHPYLNADQQSKDMIDALTAARSALPTSSASGTTDAGKLFVTGYSQGGYVAMATHRALQAAGAAVTASAPMSGPYALAAFVDAVFYGQVNGGAPISFVLTAISYQHAYGNIYANLTDVFEARYAPGIDTLLPTTTTRSNLYAQGKLPQSALFSNVPPDPAYASITPPTTPADQAALFAQGFGPDNLVTNAYRLSYLQDAQAHPDGGFPTTTTGLPPDAPANTLRQATKANDLRNWTPTSPSQLCAGHSDPTVFYLNTQLMQGYWAKSPNAPVTFLDVDSSPISDDPYRDLKLGFAAFRGLTQANAVAQGATDNGTAAVLEAYHTTLVAPFCLMATREFFDKL